MPQTFFRPMPKEAQAGPARHSGESSKERLFGLYQNEGQDEDLGKIKGAVDPRGLGRGTAAQTFAKHEESRSRR
jgi:hypothetical protein